MTENKHQKPSLAFSTIALVSVFGFMLLGLVVFKVKLQIVIFLSWLVLLPFTRKLGYTFPELEKEAYQFITKGMQACIIMMSVGALIGAWIAAGTVPTIIYAGLKIITPKLFLVTTLIFCSFVSICTGTSWGSMGTAGVAMMGVGAGLGIPAGMTAGAVICGSYFGDKMSPLSDSTNMAPALAGTDVITHIKHMLYTTVPAYIITAIIYIILGLKFGTGEFDPSQVNIITNALSENFHIGIIPVLPAVLLITMLMFKMSPVVAISVGAASGLLVAVFYQGQSLMFTTVSMYTGFDVNFELDFLNGILNRGGIMSMMGIVIAFIFALGLGGMLSYTQILQTPLDSLSKKLKSIGGIVTTTMAVSTLANMIGGSMTFSSVLTGTLMAPLFRQKGLKPENLSRCIEDFGTMGAVLIPWNGNAIFAMGVLGVSYSAYVPFCFLNWIVPVLSIIYGYTGFSMKKFSDEEMKNMKEIAS